MSRQFSMFLLVLLVLIAGIIFYQYRTYRTPVLPSDQTEFVFVKGTSSPDDIPALTQPEYESIASADVYLSDSGYGIVVEVGSRSRFYPFQILVWHEVVNDVLNGKDLFVTYDPLTYASEVYSREEATTFGVSGTVWNSNTLLYDSLTNSLWSQILGEAVQGDSMGKQLERYPMRVIRWETYKVEYPYGQVLSRDTGFDRDYTQDPYEGYFGSSAVWFPLSHEDSRLAPKSLVFGVEHDGAAVAFPVDSLEESDTIQEIVGDDQILQPMFWFAWSAIHPGTEIYSVND